MSRLFTKESEINGTGLYVNEDVRKGDHIAYIHGPIVCIRTLSNETSKKILNWIGVGRFSWIDTSGSMFRFINHSCNPNVAIIGKRKVVAIRDIEKNTEITMDYSLTDAEEGWSINCDCNHKNCRQRILPIQHLNERTFNKYNKYISPAFKKIYLLAQK